MKKLINVQDEKDNWADEIDMAIEKNNKVDSNLALSIYEGTSKAGKPFKAVKVVIGEYEGLLFPNKFEMKYIETVL